MNGKDRKEKEINEKLGRAFEHATPSFNPSALFTEGEKKGEILMMKEGRKRKNNLITFAASIAAALILLVGIGTGIYGYESYAVASTVSLDVNPSVELKVNKAGKVLDANALNEDGQTVLGSMEEKLKGVHVEVAVNALVGSMVKNGFVSDTANSILVSVNSKSEKNGAELTERLSKELNALFAGSNFEGAVLTQSVTSNSELKALADRYGISLGKARFIYQIITQNTRYTFEELVDLSINELNLLRGVQLDGVDVSGTASDKDYVGTEVAKETALAHAGISADQISRFEIEMGYEKGVMVYEIEFNHDGYEYEYDVNAQTGEILKSEKDKDEDNENRESDSDVQGTLLTKEQAMAAALAHAGLSKQDVEKIGGKKDKDDGRTLYEIEFTAGGYKYEYEVDAVTGEIVKYSKEQYDDGNSATDKSAGTAINKAQAKAIALAHAGLTGKDVEGFECKLDSENGVKVFELEFHYGAIEYEYDINAANGTIIKHEKEGMRDNDKADVLPSEDRIGREQVQNIALKHAGLSYANDMEIELYEENGKAVYEVSFRLDLVEFEYVIDAKSGEVLRVEKEIDD